MSGASMLPDDDETLPFDRRVLTAVRHLTESSGAGISPQETIKLLGADKQDRLAYLDSDFPLAVARLRQGGLLMSNPSGELRLTSAGQHQLSRSDARADEEPLTAAHPDSSSP